VIVTKSIGKFLGGAGLVLATGGLASAADLPSGIAVKAPVATAIFDWTGLYIGGHVGYGNGSFGPGTNPLPSQTIFFPYTPTGLIAGYQAGYNLQLQNRVVLGAEADISFISPLDRAKLVPLPFNTTFDYFATARGRVGYAFGTWLPYVTGGLAWGQTKVDINAADGNRPSSMRLSHVGWTAGIGLEIAVGGGWSTKIEYDYVDLARRTYSLRDAMLPDLNVDPGFHTVKVGLNYRLWDTPPWAPSSTASVTRMQTPESTDWNIHGQTTFIEQAYPRIRSVRTAFREQARGARHGPSMHSLDGGCGKAVSFISTRSSIRDLV
jgi:high affinity Mn2+ porin